jgi:DNA polymerase I
MIYSLDMKQITLIDASSLIHRAYHALPPLTTPENRPAGALYGISLILMKLREEGALEYAAAVFDRPEPLLRKAKYEAYKATRKPADDDLIAQIIEAHKLFDAFGVTTFEKAGYEADDCIATVTEKFRHDPECTIDILTGDMDMLQLVEDGHVRVRAFRKGVTDTVYFDSAGVMARWGVPPEGVISYKALVGDNSDNIKGVPGFGPKTAASLLGKYGSIDNLYKHLDEIPKYKDKLKEHEAIARLSLDLVTLDRETPIEVGDIESLRVAFNLEWIEKYFDKVGFRKLIIRLTTPQKTTEQIAEELAAKAAAKEAKKKPKKNEPNPAQTSMF